MAVVACVLAALDVHELIVLFGAGLAVPVVRGLVRRPPTTARLSPFWRCPLCPPESQPGPRPVGLWPLFWFFLKVGSVLFGSGYVLLAFLRADLVERYGWLSEQQLLDAVAVGQVTPGPVFTTATFMGYLLCGPAGAVVATVGIFLPAFVFVALSVALLPRLRRSAVAGAFLDGVNAASLALMLVVTVQLGRAALVDGLTIGLAVVSAVLLVRFRVNATWLVLGGAAAGLGRTVLAG